MGEEKKLYHRGRDEGREWILIRQRTKKEVLCKGWMRASVLGYGFSENLHMALTSWELFADVGEEVGGLRLDDGREEGGSGEGVR